MNIFIIIGGKVLDLVVFSCNFNGYISMYLVMSFFSKVTLDISKFYVFSSFFNKILDESDMIIEKFEDFSVFSK